MGKYLVVAPGYPSENNKYNNGFVHSRVVQYKKNSMDVDVFSVTTGKIHKYTYEGVSVYEGCPKEFANFIKENKYDKILVHFGYKKILRPIVKYCPNTPLIIWVHGAEALGWYRRLFAFNIKKPYRFFGYIIINTAQLMYLHKFITNKKVNKKFIFVSNWMKDILEKDSHSKGKITNYEIIPNVIDSDIFDYKEKVESDRLNILSIRTYQSKKYANDLSVKCVQELAKENFFNDLTFTFYGDGRLFNKTLEPLKKFKNVKIYQKFLNHKEISEAHKKNGIMLIPTRQDAQGVSMCEAMSSGLVPVTSNNTAIPEFVPDNCGYLANDYKELALAIKEMYENPKVFLKKSKNASKFIQKKCDSKMAIKSELKIIKENI